MNDVGATTEAAARRGSENNTCDSRGGGRFKTVKISVVVSPPSDGPAREKEKGFLRRFSIRGGSTGGEESKGGGGGLEATRQLDEAMRAQNTRLQEKIKRQARTHSLLVSIVVVFALSWFPLNVLNIVLDVKGDIFQVGTSTALSNKHRNF